MRATTLSMVLGLMFALQGCCHLADDADCPVGKCDSALTAPTVLRHVVLFKFKDSATAEDVRTVENAFSALPSKIPEIMDYEWGTNNSPEGLNEGLTHCFLLTFASEEDRAVYLPHPAHKEFGKILGPYLDKVVVVDYWAGN